MNTLYQAAAGAFIVICFVTLIWPFNIPILAGAYKIYLGDKPLDIQRQEFWVRSAFASLGLALLSGLFLLVLYVLVSVLEFQENQGPIELAVLLLYLPLAIGYVFWIFALDDMVRASGVFLLYVLIAGLPFLLVYWLAHLGTKISASAPWLLTLPH